MLISLISDLHLDHDPDNGEAFLNELDGANAYLVVVAGDVYSTYRDLTIFFLRMLEKYPEVLFVPGNHCLWGKTPQQAETGWHEAACGDPRIHIVAEPRKLVIQGQKFLAGTSWYPEPGPDQVQNFIDFRKVNVPRPWFFKQFHDFMRLFRSSDLSDTVVVTHHTVSPAAIPNEFRGSPHNHFFCNDLTVDILMQKPKLILSGHTHTPADYMVGATRCVINSRGYPAEIRARRPYKPVLIEV
jgi:predicted phosphodiesterase